MEIEIGDLLHIKQEHVGGAPVKEGWRRKLLLTGRNAISVTNWSKRHFPLTMVNNFNF